jgi:hypothetical protein
MQLETGKSKNGLVGTLRNIIREEGYVNQLELQADSRLTKRNLLGLVGFTEVKNCVMKKKKNVTERTTRIGPSFIARSTQTCRQIVGTLTICRIPGLNLLFFLGGVEKVLLMNSGEIHS